MSDPEDVVRGLHTYLRHTPAAARAVGVKADASEEAFLEAAERCILVRIQTAGSNEGSPPG